MERWLHKAEPQIPDILVDTVNYLHILLGFSRLLVLYFILISQKTEEEGEEGGCEW